MNENNEITENTVFIAQYHNFKTDPIRGFYISLANSERFILNENGALFAHPNDAYHYAIENGYNVYKFKPVSWEI